VNINDLNLSKEEKIILRVRQWNTIYVNTIL
jgi:hypothetical protein